MFGSGVGARWAAAEAARSEHLCRDTQAELGQPSKLPQGDVHRQILISVRAKGALHFAACGTQEESPQPPRSL